jgi:MFS family permease
MIVIMTAVYYLGTGIISMPRVMLINQRIAHDARNPNSQSSFVDSTSAMLSTLATVLFSKYFSALGDHVGRRPVLIISALFSLVSNIIWLSASTPLGFYVASMVSGLADIFFYVGISWICDLAPEKSQRGKAIGLYVGTVAGLTLSLGTPPPFPPCHDFPQLFRLGLCSPHAERSREHTKFLSSYISLSCSCSFFFP